MFEKSTFLVSVIVPIYHGEKYIKRIIRQCKRAFLFAQIEKKAEIIFVVDSPEEKLNVAEDCISVVYHKNNMGIHYSRIDGLKYASGKWIHFLDQDDLITRDFYMKLLAYDSYDVVIGNGRNPNPNILNHIIYVNSFRRFLAEHGWAYFLFNNRIISPSQCLIKKQSIPSYWTDNVMHHNSLDDYLLWLLMISTNMKFKVIRNIVYCHSFTGQNLSSNIDAVNKSAIEMLKIYEECPYAKHKIRMKRMVSQIIGARNDYDMLTRIITSMLKVRNRIVDHKEFIAARDL